MKAKDMRRRDWLSEEPFTLLLGAGFFGFFAHTGCLLALEDAGLRPCRVVGVSAGALAGGLWASGLPVDRISHELLSLRREDFWDPGPPLGGLLRGRKFTRKLETILEEVGVSRLEDCGVPFTAVAHDVLRGSTLALDRGPIHVAIRASCSVPFMFRPVWSEGRLLVDGGVSDRSGFTAIRPGERVLFHHLPSRRRLRSARSAAAVTPTSVPGADALMLVTPWLPRVTPFRLAQGRTALQRARAYMREWLDAPVARAHQPTGVVFGTSVPSQPHWKLSRKT
jgi:NTE family protein